MRRDVYECDLCGTDAPPRESILFRTGWQPNPAGGPSQPDGENLDLCAGCRRLVLLLALDDLGNDGVRALMPKLKTIQLRRAKG
jgi:hypothetical protein